MKYWLGVVSKSHVLRGIDGGFAQVCHGKKGPLSKMKKGDRLVYYSPGENKGEKGTLKAFTAIGTVQDREVYQFRMSEDFEPFRRKVVYKSAKQVPLESLKQNLQFTQDKNWGYRLRLGLIEISEHDFQIIAEAMGVKV